MSEPQGTDWDPALYRQFEAERTRPAADLLAQVDLRAASAVVDLGCGPGNSTELLARRFPDAALTGVDTSAAMLDEARARLPDARFVAGDVATWAPEAPVDLVFANAVLQWVPDHARLLPRLLGLVRPGGVLAVQMPDNLNEPSHRLMRDLAGNGPWRSRLADAGASRAGRMLSPEGYYDTLAPHAATVEVWRTGYRHPMASPAAIVQWLRATGLRPYLDPLPDGERGAFLARYEEELDTAYPARADGRRLLAFPRLFIVARRGS